MSSIRKRPLGDDSNESDAKKKKPDIPQKLLDILGPTFGNTNFLEKLQELYFPEKTLEECAQWIVETSGKNWFSLVGYICSGFLPDLKKNSCLSEIFVILMNTHEIYYLVENGSTDIICFFNGREIELKITGSLIENGNPIFLSEIYQLKLVNNGSMIYYEATFRKNLRLRDSEIGEVFFEPSDDPSHHLVLVGKGSYGYVFKIMGIDGKWRIVKVFSCETSAKHEWRALRIVNRKHPCLQQAIKIQTGRKGDIQHIIVSKFQGDIPLSKVRNSSYHLNLKQLFEMFLKLSNGLEKLHELGILHCDIKPDNIILSVNSKDIPCPVLIDFGIAEKIGKETPEPQSYYTLWYRIPCLVLDDFMRGLTFIEPVKLLGVMDYWAFIISFLHVISHPSNNFLGFHSKNEHEIRQDMIQTSRVAQLMLKMKPFLAGDKIRIEFVRAIYFILLNEEGPEKFVKTFNDFEITRASATTYDEYLGMFKTLTMTHPMISHVRNVFKHVRCEMDASGPMNNLNDLLVEILRDGSDLSLLGCLTMDHIQQWLDRLKESLHELSKVGGNIFFY